MTVGPEREFIGVARSTTRARGAQASGVIDEHDEE
jgi:hypothetical protein